MSLVTASLHSGHVTKVSGNAHPADFRKVIKQKIVLNCYVSFVFLEINKQADEFLWGFSVRSFRNITLSLKNTFPLS